MFGITQQRLARTSTGIAMALVLALLQVATSIASSPIVHKVSVGGPDFCDAFGLKPGCDKNYSLIAIQYADGSVKGEYNDQFGVPLSTGKSVQGVITCLSVVGNDAWISGIVTQGPDTGNPFASRVRDNGDSANDPPDQLGGSWQDSRPCT